MGNGLIVPSDYAPKPMPKAMDLFSGAGGFSCGFHQAGWHVVAASEWEPTATHTYLTNLGSPETKILFASDDDKARWEKYCAKNKVTAAEFGLGWIGQGFDHSIADCKG